MDAVKYDPYRKQAEFFEKPKPKIQEPNDVLIRVLVAGISRKDIEIVYNLNHHKLEESFILGQEFIGIVMEIGLNVSTVNVEDKVVVNPFRGCGICPWCRSGAPQNCQSRILFGYHVDGGWAQFVVVKEIQVFKIPRCLTFCQAIFTETMSRIIHGIGKIPQMSVDLKILIGGAGITGILCAALLHHLGYRNVTVSEPNLARLEIIEKMELEFECVTPLLLKENFKNNSQLLFNVVIDTTRNSFGISDNIFMITYGGTIIILGGEIDESYTSISPFHIVKNEITVLGTNINPFNYPKALALLSYMGDRYLDFDNLCIKVYELKEFKNALKHVHKGCVVKAVYSIGINCLCTKWKEKEEERKKEAAAAALALLKRKIKELALDY